MSAAFRTAERHGGLPTVAMDSGQGQHRHHLMDAPATPTRSFPFLKAGVVIGAVSGFLSGMADANTFTRDLATLILYSLVGAVLFAGILALLGGLVDVARNRRQPG